MNRRTPLAAASSSSPDLSSLQDTIAIYQIPKGSPHPPQLHTLALQIAHNLRFQHGWEDLQIHYRKTSNDASSPEYLPRPIVSGLPPQRLYVHPDEQIEALQKQRDAGRAGWPELSREREWVLPSHLREPWTLRRFAEVFDALSTVPPEKGGGPLFAHAEFMQSASPPPTPPPTLRHESSSGSSRSNDSQPDSVSADEPNKWRKKRLLLSTLDDDSTVVYYIVHDGFVKPRQHG